MSSTALAPGHPDTISSATPLTVEQMADPKVRDALSVTLSPHQAEAVGGDMVEASEERRCDDCDLLNDLTSGPTCSGCTQAAELLDARIAGALR